ncbi:hypothetical protein HJC23_006934 [Cyclotella cryptica]|uniref:WW domain-containing protein n=1 Tax=Cyclotella cryptica TaxID=29204 RepID=A0ABD3P5B9_9STRA|eukprot:CCRYP_017596-RA/>CCRYP_017596-RA protein AED:0.06 eAED:0.06 QI:205/0.83/0.85/1/0.5/0.42/7/535/1197
MIVVFVVDTSPSMAEPARAKGVSRLDVAKMAIESISRSMDKRVVDHNRSVLVASAQMVAGKQQQQIQHVGRLEQFDEFLLLSTSLQPDAFQKNGRRRSSSFEGHSTLAKPMSSSSLDSIEVAAEMHAACGAGGRLLFGCVDSLESGALIADSSGNPGGQPMGMLPHPPNRADFERELKRLRVATLPNTNDSSSKPIFPEWAGGAAGLNTALSHGLGLLSRYRLTRGRIVEHFGMGRLPWFEHQMATLAKESSFSVGGTDDHNVGRNGSPLQPACLILLTDGECLRLPPEKGGGSLRLQFGNMPLREFYKEPFRWDQRIFILHIADNSAPPLHQNLRALCEVTGGADIKIQPSISSFTKLLLRLSPPRPNPCSLPDPLRLPSMPEQSSQGKSDTPQNSTYFINGGPIVCFQAFEGGPGQNVPSLHRAMLLFAGSCEQTRWIFKQATPSSSTTEMQSFVQSPVWFFPESFYPSKKLDTLPPRPSQPLLHYSRNYQAVGSPLFDPMYVMKALHHLDQLHVSIRQQLVEFGENPSPIVNRMLQRDVYICEWLGGIEAVAESRSGSNHSGAPRTTPGREHFPVGVRGAGRPTVSGDGGENILNIGILHVPQEWVRLRELESNPQLKNQSTHKLATLTLLPPDPHILIPLLIRVAETELRTLNKIKDKGGSKACAIPKIIHLDDNWKSDFRTYLFRIPPYYLPAMRRALRSLLPPTVSSFLNPDGQEPLPLICMSRACFNKIKSGEQAAKDGNDWLRGIERDLSHQTKLPAASAIVKEKGTKTGPSAQETTSIVSFGYGQYDPRITISSYKSSLRNMPPPWKSKDWLGKDTNSLSLPVTDILSELPKSCLLPYYERWIFGGTGLTTRGLHVDGVDNDGVNVHRYPASQSVEDESLIALAGIGASTINETNINIMGDFRERLHWSRAPLTGYGGSNSTAVTTLPDGSPTFSVDDDVFPMSFFNPKTGDFIDNAQNRERARLSINFGNPFEEKRGGSIVPEQYSQRPSTPPSTPPRDAFESVEDEGEGEAAFTGKRPDSPSKSPRHISTLNLLKRKSSSSLENSSKEQTKDTTKDSEAKKARLNLPSLPPPPPSKTLLSESQKRQSHPNPARKPAPPTPTQSIMPKPAPPKRQSSADTLPVQQSQPSKQLSFTPAPLQLQDPNQKPNVDLPPQWMCVWSKSQKRWYFFDTRTNKSVWEWPPPTAK